MGARVLAFAEGVMPAENGVPLKAKFWEVLLYRAINVALRVDGGASNLHACQARMHTLPKLAQRNAADAPKYCPLPCFSLCKGINTKKIETRHRSICSIRIRKDWHSSALSSSMPFCCSINKVWEIANALLSPPNTLPPPRPLSWNHR